MIPVTNVVKPAYSVPDGRAYLVTFTCGHTERRPRIPTMVICWRCPKPPEPLDKKPRFSQEDAVTAIAGLDVRERRTKALRKARAAKG
jgi:hypothetical protein